MKKATAPSPPLWYRILCEYANVQRTRLEKSKARYDSDGVIEGDGMADFAWTLVDKHSANLTREMVVRELTAKATESGVLHVHHMVSHGDGKSLIPVGATNAKIIEMIKYAVD